MKRSYDVVIAGGGPAGLSAAEVIASRGWSVCVAERMPSIAEKVRTSGGTLVHCMRELGVPERLYHVIDALRFQAPGGHVEFAMDDPRVCVIDVRGVFRLLADRAAAAGAEVLTGTVADGPSVDYFSGYATGCRLVRRGHAPATVRARVLIDATGYASVLAKASGLHPGFRRYAFGAELELHAPNADQKNATVFLDGRHAPAQYRWVFPRGGGRVRIGVGVLHADTRASPRDLLARLRRDVAGFGVDLAGAEVVEEHHGLIPSDGLPRRFTGDGILAVGDAAGQPTLVVGEGIRVAVEAGRLAGETVADALSARDVSAARLGRYEREFRRRFERDLAIGHAVNRVLARWDDGDRDRFVRGVRDMPPAVVAKLLLSRFTDPQVVGWVMTHPVMWRTFLRAAARRLTPWARRPAELVAADASGAVPV
ncbi:MAG TPA: NAD(P)/FAD-dependent oxidoreductase [Longimicrobium sp.]|jgi:digeranylgeranylglycerophospholipid reductase